MTSLNTLSLLRLLSIKLSRLIGIGAVVRKVLSLRTGKKRKYSRKLNSKGLSNCLTINKRSKFMRNSLVNNWQQREGIVCTFACKNGMISASVVRKPSENITTCVSLMKPLRKCWNWFGVEWCSVGSFHHIDGTYMNWHFTRKNAFVEALSTSNASMLCGGFLAKAWANACWDVSGLR